MAKALGTPVWRKSEILGNIALQFNDPDISDVALKVGGKSYDVHRFVLASHSSVFKTMLTNGQWRESKQKIIDLEEAPECEAVFEEFLKFLYSGHVILTRDNVCGIHMLADKYDVPSLKEEAVTVMKLVLSGQHENALPSSLAWLRYIDQFIPDLLPACYDAIKINFQEMVTLEDVKQIEILESRDIINILSSSDVFVTGEMHIFHFVNVWAKVKFQNFLHHGTWEELKPILRLVRFQNIDANGLQKVEQTSLCKAIGKSFIEDYIAPAYKVHSQMHCIASTAGATPSGDPFEGNVCPYDSGELHCPHLDPRLYVNPKVGIYSYFNIRLGSAAMSLLPIDLGDIKMFSKLQLGLVDEFKIREWALEHKRVPDNPLNRTYESDVFTLRPTKYDIGRQYTIALSVVGPAKDVKVRYAMKHTGKVERPQQRQGLFAGPVDIINEPGTPITLRSPMRETVVFESKDEAKFILSVALHLM